MVQINFALREVNCKIVYYGPGLSGKTTNLEVIHAKAPAEFRGDLTSIATEGDRTLFFDFLPLNLGTVAGMKTKFQLYTVPGQVFYNSTRKLVLQGVDGVIFVADSRDSKLEENIESLENLQENLEEYGLKLENLPHIIQYNKRDLADIFPVEELQKRLNPYNAPYTEAAAVTGQGVFPTLKKLAGMVLENLNKQQTSSSPQRRMPGKIKEPVKTLAGRKGDPRGVTKGSGQANLQSGTSKRGQQAPTVDQQPNVLQEQVASGVKPVERRIPVKRKKTPRRSGQTQAPEGRGAAPPEPQDVQPEKPVKKRRWLTFAALALLALGIAEVALRFSDLLGGVGAVEYLIRILGK